MESSRENRLVSEVEFKPELRLAIASHKRYYQQWLEHEKLDVAWIADIYLYDNKERTCICSATPLIWAEYITSCYDSLHDRKGRDYDDESLESWFESQLDDANASEESSRYFPCFEHSVLLWDAASDKTECGWIAHVDADTTCKDLWQQTKEALFEAIASNSREFVLNLFPQEVIDKLTSA